MLEELRDAHERLTGRVDVLEQRDTLAFEVSLAALALAVLALAVVLW